MALVEAEKAAPQNASIYLQLGDAYLRLAQLQNAIDAFQKALALDEDNARAFLGLSTAYRRLADNQQTVDCALRAVSLLHRLPLAHFNLGVALARSGDKERARLASELDPFLGSRVDRNHAILNSEMIKHVQADVMKVRPRTGLIRIEKVLRELGYQPPVSRAQALGLTLGWIRETRVG